MACGPRHLGHCGRTPHTSWRRERGVALGGAPALGSACHAALFLEHKDALKRPEQQLVHGLLLGAVDEFLAELAALIEPVEVHFQWRLELRDPSDEMVLEAAINGRADALVTYNLTDISPWLANGSNYPSFDRRTH